MKTRHQRQLAAQAGVAPSPPHALIDQPRPKRTRAPKSKPASASSSETQTSAQPSTSVPPERKRQRGRGRGRSRGGKTATAARLSRDVNDDHPWSLDTEGQEAVGETAKSPHTPSQTPPLSPREDPVLEIATSPHTLSQVSTLLPWKEPAGETAKSPHTPPQTSTLPAVGLYTEWQEPVREIMISPHSPSQTSTLFAEIAASRKGTGFPGPSQGKVPFPPVEREELVSQLRQQLAKVIDESSLTRAHHVVVRIDVELSERSQAPTGDVHEDTDTNVPSLNLTVQRKDKPPHASEISSQVNEKPQDSGANEASEEQQAKEKPSAHRGQNASEKASEKHSPVPKPVAEKAGKRRRTLKESSEVNAPPRKRFKNDLKELPDLYDENGNLTLGSRKKAQLSSFTENRPPNPYTEDEVPRIDEELLYDFQPPVSEELPQQEQAPETPRAQPSPTRGWGLSSFLPSAKTVSKFIPFSSRRIPPSAVTPSRAESNVHSAGPTSADNQTTAHDRPSTPKQTLRTQQRATTPQKTSPIQRGPQTTPQQINEDQDSYMESPTPSPTDRPAKRKHVSKPKKLLLTKGQAMERDKLKREKEELRAEKERLKQEEARIAQMKKEWEEQRAKVETAQTPGAKRKRLPSPDVIPLPPGGGFGLHPDYFYFDSDEEEEEEESAEVPDPDTPTRPRPPKKARLSSSSQGSTADSRSGTAYEGGHFLMPGQSPITPHNNAFRKENGMATATPSRHPGRFAVPSPSEGDDDEEDDVNTQGVGGSPSNGLSPQTTTAVTASRSVIPPSTSQSDNATQSRTRSTTQLTPTTAARVEDARSKIMQYQPSVGSKLKQPIRFSTSTLGSDAGDDSAERTDEAQYSSLGAQSNAAQSSNFGSQADHLPGLFQPAPSQLPTADLTTVESPDDPLPGLFQPAPPQPPTAALTTAESPQAAMSAISPEKLNAREASATNQSKKAGQTSDDVTEYLAEYGVTSAYKTFKETLSPRLQAHLDQTQKKLESDEKATAPFGSVKEHKKAEDSRSGVWDGEYEQWREETLSSIARDSQETSDSPFNPSAYEKAELGDRVRIYIECFTEPDADADTEEFDEAFEEYKAGLLKEHIGTSSVVA